MRAVVQGWWRGKARGEQAFWALLAAAVLVVTLWLTVQALLGGWGALAADHRAAVERAGRVEAKLAMLEDGKGDAPTDAVAGGGAVRALTEMLADRAAEQGISLSRNDAVGDDGAAIAVASERAPAMLAWLVDLEGAGLVVDQLTMTPALDGSVTVAAQLRRVGR